MLDDIEVVTVSEEEGMEIGRCPYCGDEGDITEEHILDCDPFDR